MPVLTKLAALVGALVLALVPAACGGGDDDGSSGGSVLTQDDFVAQANAICVTSEQELAAARAQAFPGGQAGPTAAEAFNADVFIPNLEARKNALSDLTPPEDDAETFSSLLENFEEGIADAKSDPSSLSGQTPAALIEAQIQAQELGLAECAG